MAILPIRTFGDPVLRMAAAPVRTIDEGVRKLVADMIETMYAAPGVGLAAPQVGVSRRVAVFDAQDGAGARALINPVLVDATHHETSAGLSGNAGLSGDYEVSYDEGCLSLPGRFWEIFRPGFARVTALDLEGNPVEYSGTELMARVLQHELDHLDGRLLLERLETRVRKQALRELREEALGLARHER